jgi:hypothetical protein
MAARGHNACLVGFVPYAIQPTGIRRPLVPPNRSSPPRAFRRNVVHPTGTPRVAAQKPTSGKQSTTHRAMSLERDHGVLRAARMVATRRRRERRNVSLVAANRDDEQSAGKRHNRTNAAHPRLPARWIAEPSADTTSRRNSA